jgi:predicted permease
MEPLSLAFIGWFFAGFSGLVLAVGATLIMSLHRSGELVRRHLEKSVVNDAALFGIWIFGLAGGIGVIRLEPWGRDVLEFFCWTLIVLAMLSGGMRLQAIKRVATEPVNWFSAVAGVAVVVVPIVLLCAGTIITLRSEAAIAVFTR